ncbi:hypothetical protein DTO012A9_10204 [Penicillium roqueforti]|nr:hypothetical protein DTO012A9_10204 [Penicillium roqueforti]
MSSATYRLETFRSWNPTQEKAQPSRNPVNTCRYPSPVSIAAAPSPSNPRDPLSESQKVSLPKPKLHPLPVRPPMEVCLHGDLQPHTQIVRVGPEVLEPPPPFNEDIETFDPESILHAQDLSGHGNVDHSSIFGDIGQDSEHQLPSFESGDPKLAFTAGQQSRVEAPVNPTQTEYLSDDATIDPAILDGYHFPDVRQTQAAEPTPRVAIRSSESPAGNSRFLDKDVCSRGRRHSSKGKVKPIRQLSKINKVAGVVESRGKNRTRRFACGLGCKNDVSFPTVRAQFSALSVNNRLQFLSWLFEGALPRCLPSPSTTNDTPVSTCISDHDEDMTPTSSNSSTSGDTVNAEHTCASRKGLPWSVEEGRLLVKLREKQNLAWPEVTKRFCQKFPGRSSGSIQVYWSTTLRKQRLSLAKDN